jgi:hypothetical protein
MAIEAFRGPYVSDTSGELIAKASKPTLYFSAGYPLIQVSVIQENDARIGIQVARSDERFFTPPPEPVHGIPAVEVLDFALDVTEEGVVTGLHQGVVFAVKPESDELAYEFRYREVPLPFTDGVVVLVDSVTYMGKPEFALPTTASIFALGSHTILDSYTGLPRIANWKHTAEVLLTGKNPDHTDLTAADFSTDLLRK